MNWSKLFFWKKQRKKFGALPSTNLDQKLLRKVQANFLPKWPQLRYLKNFLSKKEKQIVGLALVVIFLTTAIWGVLIFFKNNTLAPASGGDYSEALIGQPKFINPLFTPINDVDADIASLILSGLFKYSPQQKLTPDLASGYTISADGKTYEINLRQDVKWSDGEPFTANDVIYTFETIQDPEVGSPLLAAFQNVQIERDGDYAVRFILKESFAPFLSSLTTGISPEHIWANVPPSGIRLAKTNLQPIGTGAWKFNKLTKDSGGNIQNYSMDRNPVYYGSAPYFKTVTFKFYTDFAQAASALKAQDVMAISFLPYDLANKISGPRQGGASKNFQLHKFKLPQYTALFFNQDAAPALKDSELRLALNLSIDKNQLLAQMPGSGGEAISSPILPDDLGYDPEAPFPAFDANKAGQILDKNWKQVQPEDYFKSQYDAILKTRQQQTTATSTKQTSSTPEELAGEKAAVEKEISDTVRQGMDAEQSFYRKNKNNEILEITITTVDTPEYQQVAEAVAKMWRAVGVKIKTQIVGGSQINKEVLRDRAYQVLLYGEIVGGDPDPYPFWHSSQINYPGLNLSLFAHRAADKLLEDARATTTESKRIESYKKFQEILAKEIPAIFLYTSTYNFLTSKEIKGVVLNQIFSPAERLNGLNNWYIKTKRQWRR